MKLFESKEQLLYNDFQYLIPISLVLIFILSFIYRNRSWKKCLKAFILFFICGIFHYFFFVIVYHLPPKPSWKIFSFCLLIDSFKWIIHIWFNFLLLTLVWKLLHRCKAATGIYGLISVLYIMFFIWIYCYTFLLLDPLLGFLRLLPDIQY